MFETTLKWLNDHPKSNGRVLEEVLCFFLHLLISFKIRFTNFDDETVYLMKKEFHKRFGGGDESIEKSEKPEKPVETPVLLTVPPPVEREPTAPEWEEDPEGVELVDLDEDTIDGETN